MTEAARSEQDPSDHGLIRLYGTIQKEPQIGHGAAVCPECGRWVWRQVVKFWGYPSRNYSIKLFPEHRTRFFRRCPASNRAFRSINNGPIQPDIPVEVPA